MTESLVFDFGKLLQEAKAGAAWPEGDYDFEIIESEAVISGNGSPMVRAKLRCLAGTYANKTMTNNFVLTVDNGLALKMFFRHMKALGLDENFFLQIGHGDLRPVAAALLHRRATFTIGHREWPAGSGELSNNVVGVKPLGAGGALAGMPAGTMGGMPTAVPGGMPTMVPPPPPAFGTQPQPQPGYGGLDVFKQPADQQQPLPSGAAFQPPMPQQPMPGMVPPPPQPPMQPQMPPPPPAANYPPQQQPYAPQQQPYAPQQQPYAQQPYQPPMPEPQGANGATMPPPPGFSPEQWATFPEATKQAIIASQQPAAPPQPI